MVNKLEFLKGGYSSFFETEYAGYQWNVEI